MRKNYANARDVLPGDLFEKVRKHYTGELYVPVENSKAQSMKNLVLGMISRGASSREIGIITGLTRRRVNQIRAEYREAVKKT